MRRFGIAIGTAAALSSLLIGGTVVKAQNAPAPTPAPSTAASTTAASTTVAAAPAPAAVGTFTLPLLLSSLTVQVTTDVGGGLLDVTLGGTSAEIGATTAPDSVRPGRVSFVNEAGTVKVKVSAKDGGERVQVRAGALADISGPGGWTGDVFGDGQTTTVAFTIGAGADGGPDITGITVTSPVTNTVGTVERSTDTDDDDGELEQEAKVTITFSQNGQTRKLTIKAEVETENGVTESKLRISLGRLKGAAIADGPAVGPHTWTGNLCDGTAATISYTVDEAGNITGVTSTPAAEVSGDSDEVKVTFTSGDRVKIETENEDGVLTVRVRERFRCDRVLPTVNGQQVSTSTTIDDDDDDEEDDDDHRGRNRGGGDDDDDDDDDHSSTSVAGGGATSTTVDDDDDHGGDDDSDD